ncbi:hypothetical protein ABIA30_004440 [Mycobacterium sp. MAA66]|uniref:hypothetical protein n=1 Tax=Mycobacterium sp. MAA66 TaxID=3156297 RepID=UPI0035195515
MNAIKVDHGLARTGIGRSSPHLCRDRDPCATTRPVFGSVGVDGLDRPLLMLAGDDPAWTDRPGWNANWTNNIGEKVLLRLAGAAHMSFIDQQVVIPQLVSAGLLLPGSAESIVGTIDPVRSIDLQRTYVRTFLNAVFADTDPRSAVNDLAAPEIEVHP